MPHIGYVLASQLSPILLSLHLSSSSSQSLNTFLAIYLNGVISQEASHEANTVLNGDALVCGLVGGGILWTEAVVVGCKDRKVSWSQTRPF